MKLLFDRHLGPSLVHRLADVFPDSEHVDRVSLSTAADIEIWEFARTRGFVIVSKDRDFEHFSAARGHPPKVVALRIGNCSVQFSADLLRKHSPTLHTFEQDTRKALLVLKR
jgi:predicted nuclease of predicted toxin-antitoxin system